MFFKISLLLCDEFLFVMQIRDRQKCVYTQCEHMYCFDKFIKLIHRQNSQFNVMD